MESNNTEAKMQYILDENKNLVEIPMTDMIPVEYPIKCKLISAFEVFVRVPLTENYWISNYGRCVNNRKSPNKIYEHMFFASTFWRKMQNIFGECCISKLEKVAKP